MAKTLVAYFSKTGNTKRVAELIAEVKGADLYEIKEKIEYTKEDLDWKNPESRATKEMGDLDAKPEVLGKCENFDQYDTVFLGFPIWRYTIPKVVLTFLEDYDFTGKKLITFGTSAMSDLGEATFAIEKAINYKTEVHGEEVFDKNTDKKEIENRVKSL